MRRGAWLVVGVLSVVGCSSGSSGSSGSPSTAPATSAAAVTASTTTVRPPVTETLAKTQLTGDVAFLGPIRRVAVGPLRMAYRQFGHGPDLVLIAGQASPMSLWPASTLAALAKAHRVTIYDNRDLGHTVGPAAQFTLPDLADDAAGLIGALGMHRPAVFGWSTGGEIGLLLAVRHPTALSALAVTGATPGGPGTVQPTPEVNALFASADPDVDKLFDVLFATDAARTAFITDYVKVPQSPMTAEATHRYDVAERRYWSDPEPDLAAIRVPVLVMNGAADYAVPSANATYIAKRIGPRARLALDPGGRHGWFIEHPAHFAALMGEFLH